MKSARLRIRRYLGDVVACRLCQNVALLVLISILIVKGSISVPSYRNYDRDLLLRLGRVGETIVSAALRSEGHSSKRKILMAGRIMVAAPQVVDHAIYGADGVAIGIFGEAPGLRPHSQVKKKRSEARNRYAFVCKGGALHLPFDVVANLNTDWTAGELAAFLQQIFGLVLLITGFATLATMAVIRDFVLSPLLRLHDHLNAAAADPENPLSIAIGGKRQDELGEDMQQFDTSLHLASSARLSGRERLAAMVDNSANAIFAAEPDGRLVYDNRARVSLAKLTEIGQMKQLSEPLIIKSDGAEMPIAQYLLIADDTAEVELLDAAGRRTIRIIGINRLAGEDGGAWVRISNTGTGIPAERCPATLHPIGGELCTKSPRHLPWSAAR
jgi:PAS domain-containing protein